MALSACVQTKQYADVEFAPPQGDYKLLVMSVEIGSGSLIPGFEDGLIGAKTGDERKVDVKFPDDYPAENLKGKPAQFAVKVTDVKVAGETKVDEDFAKALGLTGLDQLKGLIKDQLQQELNGLTRTHMGPKASRTSRICSPMPILAPVRSLITGAPDR